MTRLKLGNCLSRMGINSVWYNEDLFTQRFQSEISQGSSKGRVTKVMLDTLTEVAEQMEEEGRYEIGLPVNGQRMYGFYLLADLGRDWYTSSEMILQDAKCLVEENYDVFSKSRLRGSSQKTARRRKTSSKTTPKSSSVRTKTGSTKGARR